MGNLRTPVDSSNVDNVELVSSITTISRYKFEIQ